MNKKYWIKLRNQEEFPMVVELSNDIDNLKGLVTGIRSFKNGDQKKVAFQIDDVISAEEFEEMEEEIEEEIEEEE